MRVVVVGAGMSGLCCSRVLVERSHQVVLITADHLHQTTSYLAAAMWFPTAVGPPEAVARWGAITFDVLAAEAAARVPGVVMRESLVLYRETPAAGEPLPAWSAAVGDVRTARPEELPPGYPFGLRFVAPLVEMPLYLPYLQKAVVAAGVHRVVRRVAGLDDVLDLEPEVIVNAAGMAAGALVGDGASVPVGHTGLVNLYSYKGTADKGTADPILVAMAVVLSTEDLFSDTWVIVTEDKEVRAKAKEFSIGTLTPKKLAEVIDAATKAAESCVSQ